MVWKNDLYLAAAYLVPDNSPYAQVQDIHEEFSKEIDHYSHHGDIAILGDLNSRIGDRQEANYNINTDGHDIK